MKLLVQTQVSAIADDARARIAMVRPVLRGVLFSLKRDRVDRFGGFPKITLEDLAREHREGSGDCGICFEYAVHDAVRSKDKLLYPRISEVLESFCGIKGGAESILFGAEKKGKLGLIDTSESLITDESRLLVGSRGQPAKLKKHLETAKKAFNSDTHKALLPQSIRGIWKADLFLGSSGPDQWVGSTLKIKKDDLEAAAGLRLAVFPEAQKGEAPKRDDSKNLILCPVPYEQNFMELFYSAFFIVMQVLKADAKVPKEVALPHAADRHVAAELVARRSFPLLDVIEALAAMAQPELLSESAAGAEDSETSAIAPVPATT